MKLIIDIDEQHFELLQMAVMNGMGDNAQKIIAQGIPLDKIRDEIKAEKIKEKRYDNNNHIFTHKDICIGLQVALDIIDKYRKEQNDKD